MRGVEALLAEIRCKGAIVSLKGTKLHLKAPPGVLTPEVLEEIRANRRQMLEHLAGGVTGLAVGLLDPPGEDQLGQDRPAEGEREAHAELGRSLLVPQGQQQDLFVQR